MMNHELHSARCVGNYVGLPKVWLTASLEVSESHWNIRRLRLPSRLLIGRVLHAHVHRDLSGVLLYHVVERLYHLRVNGSATSCRKDLPARRGNVKRRLASVVHYVQA